MKKARKEKIGSVVKHLIDTDHFIDSVAAVKGEVKNAANIKAKYGEVHQIMRKDFKMRFKKIHPIGRHTYSHKNLVLCL